MKPDIEMLKAAVTKAVEVGLLPSHDTPERTAKNWERIQHVIQAAVDAAPGEFVERHQLEALRQSDAVARWNQSGPYNHPA